MFIEILKLNPSRQNSALNRTNQIMAARVKRVVTWAIA